MKFLEVNGKQEGYVEYVPGEHNWRGIEAPGFYAIHCIYIHAKKAKNKGIGSALLQSVIEDAKKSDMDGVAVLVSEESFLAGREIFEKNGFDVLEDPNNSGFEIAYLTLKESAAIPCFTEIDKDLSEYKGLHIIYTDQCPYVAKNVNQLANTAKKHGFTPQVTKIEDAQSARQLPSPYGTFMIIYDGELKAEHYVSNSRFKNILTKEL